jgi:hypothetical protein
MKKAFKASIAGSLLLTVGVGCSDVFIDPVAFLGGSLWLV